VRIQAFSSTLILVTATTVAALSACSSGGDTGGGGTGGTTTHTTSTHTQPGFGGNVPLPDTFTVTGTVTDGTSPVEGAAVMQGGGAVQMTTGKDGKYSITMKNGPGIPTVVAAKLGYRSAGTEIFDLPSGDIDLTIIYAEPPDNFSYVYGDPGTGDPAHDNNTGICGHCHTTYVKDFQDSGHAEATRNSAVHDLYAGVSEVYTDQQGCEAAGGKWRTGTVPGTPTAGSKCYLGAGVLPDLNKGCGGPGELTCDDPALDASKKPTAFGRCADCHAPGMDGPAGGRNLLDATGIAYAYGNHCDVCHHVKDVDLTKEPGVAGALIIQRPRELESSQPGAKVLQVLYGPEPDCPNGFMGGSWQPKFRSSELCGGCHEQKQEALVPGTSIDPVRWPNGLPTHSTYSEWAASATPTSPTCQVCHMPPDNHGLTNSVDVAKPAGAGLTDGFPRTPEQLRRHIFRGPVDGTPRDFDGALTLDISAAPANGALGVTVSITNANGGHAIPTGEPMRSLLLVLRADACGAEMVPSGGMTIDDWGGAATIGTVGAAGVTVAGNQVTWAGASGLAKVGAVVRAVRPTGTYDDYVGVGFFADPTLTPPEKGIEIHAPAGEATITAVNGTTITLSAPLGAQAGDILYLGEPLAWPPMDGTDAIALAGRAGYSFARTLVDASGARGAPHYRAVDMISDNRIPPLATAKTTHSFAIPPGCNAATVSAVLLYRPFPLVLGRERGWETQDFVVATGTAMSTLP
jgi:hypothetical protein